MSYTCSEDATLSQEYHFINVKRISANAYSTPLRQISEGGCEFQVSLAN